MTALELIEGSWEIVNAFNGVDWIFALALFGVSYFLESNDPFYRLFSLDDRHIQYPYVKDQRVSGRMCAFLSTGVPIIVMAISCLLIPVARRREKHPQYSRVHLLLISVLGLVTSLSLAGFITSIFKNFLGQPRPDFIARCEPALNTPHHGLVNVSVCTTTHLERLADGMRSMPSGHASNAFSGLFYLTLWLFGQLMVSTPGVAMFKALLSMLPVLGAGLVAISRTMDYRHGLVDVTVGSLIGISMALFSYRKFFPAITGPDPYLPYAETPSVLRELEGYPSNNGQYTEINGLDQQYP
ncbi:hypothetical protein CANCADRAFT_3953 [Tortispora caseinolytica NRRL Y-17796]|uniref:Phosphatidic acid phosphatase type 2/haloperoxidase domain-containing protein n=1 Tax=Tortispora caseinolytica NRRL Y-17796 TaxID=767744 RepID=A0A1E4TC29_9ASCO|nr:hypothetical protein CANCADRAFT_3953 [Tortispora caseinolytica NRRL Y-17796]